MRTTGKKERRERSRQRRADKRVKRDLNRYNKYARTVLPRPPRPLRTPLVLAMATIVVFVYYNITMLFMKGGIAYLQEYVILIGAGLFMGIVLMLRESMAVSVGRTFKFKISELPSMVADGHYPGQLVKEIGFNGIDENSGDEFNEKRWVELGWCGPVKRWPWKGKGPVVILLCQYGLERGKTFKPQAGFMLGDEYVCPVKPTIYRMDMLRESRDSRYAGMIDSTEELKGRVHDRTWVVLGTIPAPLPDRKVYAGPSVDDMELYHERRLRSKLQAVIHDHGIDMRISDRIGVNR